MYAAFVAEPRSTMHSPSAAAVDAKVTPLRFTLTHACDVVSPLTASDVTDPMPDDAGSSDPALDGGRISTDSVADPPGDLAMNRTRVSVTVEPEGNVTLSNLNHCEVHADPPTDASRIVGVIPDHPVNDDSSVSALVVVESTVVDVVFDDASYDRLRDDN